MIYIIKVKFDQNEKFIINENNNEIEISITTTPIKGQANKEIIRRISEYFNIHKRNIKIIHGLYSKTKTVEIL